MLKKKNITTKQKLHAHYIQTMILKPSEIYYSQDSISKTFDRRSSHKCYTIGQTLDDILTGRCNLESIPKISVLQISGKLEKWFSVDNRRLWVFKQLQRLGYCNTIEVNVSYYNYLLHRKKFTSVNGGVSIRIRGDGDPGGRGHSLPDNWLQRKKLQTKKAQNEHVATQYKETNTPNSTNIKIKRSEAINRSYAETGLYDESKRKQHEALKHHLNDGNMYNKRVTDHGSSSDVTLRERLRTKSPVSFYSHTNDELHQPTKHSLLEKSSIRLSRNYDIDTVEGNIELDRRMKSQRRAAETYLSIRNKVKQYEALKHHLNDENMYSKRVTDQGSSSIGAMRDRLRTESPVSFDSRTYDKLHRQTNYNLAESNIEHSKKYGIDTVERNNELDCRMKSQKRIAQTHVSTASKFNPNETLKHHLYEENLYHRGLTDQVSASDGFRERLRTESPISFYNPTNNKLHHPENYDFPKNLVKQRKARMQNEQGTLNMKPAEAEIKLETPNESLKTGVCSKESQSSREASSKENAMISKYTAELLENCFITRPQHALESHIISSKDLSSGPTIQPGLHKSKDQRKECHFRDTFNLPSKQDHVYQSRSTAPKEKVKIAWNDTVEEYNSDRKTHVACFKDDLHHGTVSVHKKHHSKNRKAESPEENETRKGLSNTTVDSRKIMKMSFADAKMENVDPLGEKREQSLLFTRTFPRKPSVIRIKYPGYGIIYKSIAPENNWSTETLYGSSDDSSVSSYDT